MSDVKEQSVEEEDREKERESENEIDLKFRKNGTNRIIFKIRKSC